MVSDLAASDGDGVADLVESVRSRQLPPARERRRIRERAGVSLRDAAAAIGVNPMTIVAWEKGSQPRAEHAIAYRRLLDALDEVSP